MRERRKGEVGLSSVCGGAGGEEVASPKQRDGYKIPGGVADVRGFDSEGERGGQGDVGEYEQVFELEMAQARKVDRLRQVSHR